MTFYSLRLTERPEDASDEALARCDTPLSTVRELDGHARDWGPYGMRRWADARGLTVHYVDNCWVRVETTADLAAAFLSELGEPPADLKPDGRYLIEAEEF